jgi:DNA-dependent protein kinase catalytic subunit
MACLEAFSREPLLDWARSANREGVAPAELASRRLAVVRRKLEAVHPAVVMLAEFRAAGNPKFAGADEQAALAAVLGGEPGCARARVAAAGRGERCGSARLQARCLLDMAGDANLLARTWQGWRPWL